MIDLTVTVVRYWTEPVNLGRGGTRPVERQEVAITCGSYRAKVIMCTCRDGRTTPYESASALSCDSDKRRTLARCKSGHLHRRQVDEPIKRLVTSFGGKKKANVKITGSREGS